MKSATLHTTLIPVGFSDGLANRAGNSVDIQTFLPGLSALSATALGKDAVLIPDRIPVTHTQRLVVLIPDGEIDENALARRVWQLAVGMGPKVLYLALAPGDHQVAYQRRRLAGLAFMTTGNGVRAQTSVSIKNNWPQALEEALHPGDLLICLADHQISDRIVWRRALGEVLAESVAVPVYLLAGLKIGLAPYQRRWIKEMLSWTASLIWMATFFGLQVEIVRSTGGSVSTLLLCLSILVEFYFLWKINEWIG
ncbi:MAG: hypothetical protein JXA78_10365 [Anaerolineales bacterium]|nr:hypothetical protein [Anaerolineales bacterium]